MHQTSPTQPPQPFEKKTEHFWKKDQKIFLAKLKFKFFVRQ